MGRLYDAFVEVGPRFTGFGDIKKQGDKAGAEYGKALAEAAAKAAAAKVGKLGDALAKARTGEAEAAGKVRVAEAKLNEVRNDSKAKASQIAAAEEALASAQRKSAAATNTAKTAAESLEKARAKVSKTAAASGEQAGQKFGAGMKDALSKVKTDDEGAKSGRRFGIGFSKQLPLIGGRVTSFFKTGIGTAVGLAAGAVVGGGFVAGMQEALSQGDTKAKLQAQLGLSDADAAVAGKAAGDLYTGAYGESLGQVNDAIRHVVQDTNTSLRSVDLKTITGEVLSLAQTFDLDLGGVTRGVGNLLRNGLAPNAKVALDIITKGFQGGADKSEDFLDTLNEYGTQFRKLGISGATATGLISQGLKAGARDGDTVADALKEFSIRAIDGSKLTSQGFKSLGLDADKLSKQIGKGGKPAAAGLQLVLDKLRLIKDPVKREAAAVALFGTKAEDLGKALFALDPSTAVKGLGQVGGAADKLNKTVGSTPQQALTAFFRNLKQGSVDNLGALIKGFQDGKSSGEGFIGFLSGVGPRPREIINEIKGGIFAFSAAWKANDGDITSSGFPGFMERLAYAAHQAFDYFKAEVLPRLKEFGGYIRDTIIPIVGDFISSRLSALKDVFGQVKQAIADNRPQLEQLVGAIAKVAKFVIEQLIPFLSKLSLSTMPLLGKGISTVINTVGLMVDGFIFFKTMAQGVIAVVVDTFLGFVGTVIDGAAKAFGWVPKLGPKLKAAADDFAKFRDDVNAKLAGIKDQTITIKPSVVAAARAQTQVTGRGAGHAILATGGPVPGFSPTKTADNIPIMGTAGEFMQPVDSVKHYGPAFMEAVRTRRFPKPDGFAKGGGVGFDVKTKFPSLSAMTTDISDVAVAVARPLAQTLGDKLAATFQTLGPGGPPGGKHSFRGQTLNTRTINMLLAAEKILGHIFHITQGSYSTRVAASGGTHSGGGAMDTNGPGGWYRAQNALRKVGFASWVRLPSQGPWHEHIHSIAIGDPSASPSAKRQVQDYLRGGDGLGSIGRGKKTATRNRGHDLNGMAQGGLLRQFGIDTFDTGGRWRTGTFGYNGSGKTETVRTHEQEASLRKPISVTIPIHIGDEVVRVVRGEIDAAGEFSGTVGRMHR